MAARLAKDGISYTEFSYQLLQSFDFLELFRRYDCTLQTGGSDQWGNITAGVDLIRRVEAKQAHALTTPLLTKADGTKFGKTESGTVWLDAELTSPYAFYQFWMNADDRDVPKLLKTYSFANKETIDELIAKTESEPHVRAGQRHLAQELTALVHGDDAKTGVEAAAKALFGQGDIAELPISVLSAALLEAPNGTVEPGEIEGGLLPSVDELFVRSGLAKSKGEAKRTVNEGGAYLNNVRIDDPLQRPSTSDLLGGQWLLLRRGKRNIGGIRLVK